MTTPSDSVTQPIPALPRESATASPAVYEMRTLRTDAEREEAAALVEDRQRWLALRGLPVSRTDIPARYRHPQALPAGLYEDGLLLACMIPRRDDERCLFLDCVHTLPDRPDSITLLITLWASDFAARLGLPRVRTEALARHTPGIGLIPFAVLLRRLIDMGWDHQGYGIGQEADRVARLELAAEHRPGLSVLIGCRVHVPETAPADRGDA